MTVMRHTTHKKTLEPHEPFSDDAKVWIWDRGTVDDWNNTLNSLLALAGVLIAILTISLNALSQITQKHYAQATLSLMKEIVTQMNRTHLSGESVTFDVPRSVSTLPREPFSEVEFEWWSSLTISLSAAMGTVVLKLWLSAYISSTVSGSLIHKRNLAERSCLKLLRWCKVTPIINILAISLYCAFEHFLTGLLMLFGVSSMIASIISSLGRNTLMELTLTNFNLITTRLSRMSPSYFPSKEVFFELSRHQLLYINFFHHLTDTVSFLLRMFTVLQQQDHIHHPSSELARTIPASMQQNTTYQRTLERRGHEQGQHLNLANNKELKYPGNPFGEDDESARAQMKLTSLAGEGKECDRDLVIGWNNILNNLLIAFGLLSVILIRSLYVLFQQYHAQIPMSLMQDIVAQLNKADLSGETVTVNISSSLAVSILPCEPFPNAGLVKFSWWYNLILCLSAAMGAVILKLWLCTYVYPTASESLIHKKALPDGSCFIFLKLSRVPLIINILAAILHLALGSLLSGLLISFGLNYKVAGCITGLVFGSFFPNLITSIFPSLLPLLGRV